MWFNISDETIKEYISDVLKENIQNYNKRWIVKGLNNPAVGTLYTLTYDLSTQRKIMIGRTFVQGASSTMNLLTSVQYTAVKAGQIAGSCNTWFTNLMGFQNWSESGFFDKLVLSTNTSTGQINLWFEGFEIEY